MQLDLSQDYRSWDNTVQVSYVNTLNTGSQTDTIPVAKRRPISQYEMAASNGAYQAGDVLFLIPGPLLVNAEPKPADQVIDDEGTVFTVLSADGGKLDKAGEYQTWKITTRNVAVAFGLNDVVNIERSAIDYDTTGSATRAWPSDGGAQGGKVIYSKLACRVQPESAEIAEERGLKGQETRYTIFVSRQLDLLDVRECRAAWLQANKKPAIYLDLLAYRNAQKIGELPMIEAVLRV